MKKRSIKKFFAKKQKYLDHHKALQYSLIVTVIIIILIWGVPLIINILSATGAVDAGSAEVAGKQYIENLQEAVRMVPQAAEKVSQGTISILDYLLSHAQALATLALIIPNMILMWRKVLRKSND